MMESRANVICVRDACGKRRDGSNGSVSVDKNSDITRLTLRLDVPFSRYEIL